MACMLVRVTMTTEASESRKYDWTEDPYVDILSTVSKDSRSRVKSYDDVVLGITCGELGRNECLFHIFDHCKLPAQRESELRARNSG